MESLATHRQTKVTNLDVVITAEEEVAKLQVAVDDFVAVHVLDTLQLPSYHRHPVSWHIALVGFART